MSTDMSKGSAAVTLADSDFAVDRKTHDVRSAALDYWSRVRAGDLGALPAIFGMVALVVLFTALRPELAPRGISVTMVHPTFVTGGGMTEVPRAEGVQRTTTGPEITPDDVAREIVQAVLKGRDLVLVGRTAKLSWWVHRLLPRLYVRLMVRRLRQGG